MSDAPEFKFTFRGPWFSPAEAAAYVCSKSVKAFSEWKRRKGIVSRSNGSVAKTDLDRVLRRKKTRKPMAAASLANLRLNHRRHEQGGQSDGAVKTSRSAQRVSRTRIGARQGEQRWTSSK
jgi:hypothetical protein